MNFARFQYLVSAAGLEVSLPVTAHRYPRCKAYWCEYKDRDGDNIHTEAERTPAKALDTLLASLAPYVSMPSLA
jgi:hypothetical protein